MSKNSLENGVNGPVGFGYQRTQSRTVRTGVSPMKADQPAESHDQMADLPLRMPLMFERIAAKVGQRPRTDRSGQDLDVTWRRNAACRDTDPSLFFPIGVTGSALVQIGDAREVCMSCSCQEACLEFALRSNQDTGIWGGASEEERRHLRRTYINKRGRLAANWLFVSGRFTPRRGRRVPSRSRRSRFRPLEACEAPGFSPGR